MYVCVCGTSCECAALLGCKLASLVVPANHRVGYARSPAHVLIIVTHPSLIFRTMCPPALQDRIFDMPTREWFDKTLVEVGFKRAPL